MTYKNMIDAARSCGAYTEKTMHRSIDEVSTLLDELRQSNEQMYWRFMRRQHSVLYNNHYSEAFALHDVSKMVHTCKDARKHTGEHWSVEQVEEATKNITFPQGVNRWDKYVAFNAAASDFCRHFDDKQIIQLAYDFYFADEDYPSADKIWRYMCMIYGC